MTDHELRRLRQVDAHLELSLYAIEKGTIIEHVDYAKKLLVSIIKDAASKREK